MISLKENSSLYEGASLYIRDTAIYPGYFPYEYAGTKKEILGCRESAWLGVYLINMTRQDVIGPDAVKLLNDHCVNRDFGKLKMGGSRHALICNSKGQLVANGVVIRAGEEHFITYGLIPPLYIIGASGKYNVKIVNLDEFIYQIDGPRSLEIMEKASGTDLHDMKFGHNKEIKIAGADVLIHRLGMSGALAYEVHGTPENADKVYAAIREAGKEYDLRPLGIKNYPANNHTAGGYPNQMVHFVYAYDMEEPGYRDFEQFLVTIVGSASDDKNNGYVTPYDLGWGNLINFEHEFVGREALLKMSENPSRQPVTLEWNAEDVASVVATQFSGMETEPCEDILEINDKVSEFKYVRVDKVLVNDEMIGVTAGRVIDYFDRTFISMAFIDKAYIEEGTEVEILWGTPGTPQKKIRAKVAKYPYYNGEYRNETFDVSVIPRING